MTVETEDKLADAKRQALAQFASIKEMVAALDCAIEDADGPRQRIEEDALSVQVRSGWVDPGKWDAAHARDRARPEEYEILLCTGGPAVRIVGTLSEHCEPQTARLEYQDWFQPWTEMPACNAHCSHQEFQSILLAYCRCFWFGE